MQIQLNWIKIKLEIETKLQLEINRFLFEFNQVQIRICNSIFWIKLDLNSKLN